MSSPTAIVRVTARNVLGLRRLIGFGLLSVIPAGIYLLVAGQLSEGDKVEAFAGFVTTLLLPVIVPIVTIVVAGSVLGSERRGDTLSFLMLRPLSRFSIAGSKLVAAVVAAFAVTGIGAALLGALGSIIVGEWRYLGAVLVATLVACMGYAALFVPLGYLTERATLIGLIYMFVWELGLSAAIGGLSATSLWRTSVSALAGLAAETLNSEVLTETLGTMTPGAGGALIKVVVLCALSTLLTGWMLRTRDLI